MNEILSDTFIIFSVTQIWTMNPQSYDLDGECLCCRPFKQKQFTIPSPKFWHEQYSKHHRKLGSPRISSLNVKNSRFLLIIIQRMSFAIHLLKKFIYFYWQVRLTEKRDRQISLICWFATQAATMTGVKPFWSQESGTSDFPMWMQGLKALGIW